MNRQRDTGKQFLVPLYLGLLTIALIVIVSLHVSRYMTYRSLQQSAMNSRMSYQQGIINRFFRDIAAEANLFSSSIRYLSGDAPHMLDLLLGSKPQYRSITVYSMEGTPILHTPGGLPAAENQDPLSAPLLQRLTFLSGESIILESKFFNTAALWTEPVPPVLQLWARGTNAHSENPFFVRITVDITVLTAMLFPEGPNDPYSHYLVTSEGKIISLHGSAETLPSPEILQKVLESGKVTQSEWISNILISSGLINLNPGGGNLRILSDVYHLVSVLPGAAADSMMESRLAAYVVWFMLSALLLIPVALFINRAIMHREEAEGKLIKSLQLQSAILRTLPDSIFRIDEEEQLQPVQLHPYTNRILQSQDFPVSLDAAFSDDLSYKVRYYRNIVLDLEREAWFEYRQEGRRGFFFEFRFVKSGEEEVILVVRNRTEEREQQRRLYTTSQFLDAYRQAMDASSLVAKTDRKGKIIFMNDHFRDRFSSDFTDSVGRDLLEVMHPLNGAENPFPDSFVPRHLTRLSGLIKCRSAKGNEYFIDNSLLPVLDENGQIQEIISFGHDVTDLHNALEQARAAEHARASFIARMSHEMRTPLNCIIGFAEAAEEVEDINTGHHYSRMILTESGSLLDLINQVLDFSKIEAGKLKPQNELFHLAGLLDSVLQSHRETAERKKLKLDLSVPENLPVYVSGDALRIRQILNNLLSNALKFTDYGEVSLTAETLQTDINGGVIRFLVRDTGIGIPEEMQERIFDSFFQADTGDNRRYGGTGLGTTIARQLVEIMGGTIAFKSEPGRGSSFWFDLYMQNGDLREGDATFSDTKKITGVPDLRGKRILIAEDYRPNAEVMQIMLKPTRAVLLFASDGTAAVDLFTAEHPDLVFMDVHMPEKNGYEATEEIRALEADNSLAAIPVIGVTANAFKRDIRRCHESGMDRVLVKPLRKNDLYTVLDEIFSDSGGSASTVQPEEANSHLLFDSEALLAEVDGDTVLAGTLIRGFVDSLDEQRSVIERAMAKRDWTTLHREVHSIKGGAANLFADPLRRTALKLEQAARREDQSASEDAYPPFIEALDTFLSWPQISEFLRDGRESSDKRNN